MTERDTREEICPDCLAGEHNKDVRITTMRKDEATGQYYGLVTWHTNDCPTYTVNQILAEEGVRQAKEREAWMKEAYPAAYERLKAAVVAVEPNDVAAPFAAALLELVAQQAEDLGRFVPPDRWAEILDKHFPPADETGGS